MKLQIMILDSDVASDDVFSTVILVQMVFSDSDDASDDVFRQSYWFR